MSAVSVLDSLVRAGVRHFVLSPGSRNAPFSYALGALDAAGTVTVHVRTDERSAGFTALGLAKGSNRPAAVVTTSGTAVGNLLPAVMEGAHSGIPLIVLSADRPPRLRGTGANQTTRQPGIFSHFVGAQADLTNYHQGQAEETKALAACLNTVFGRSAENWNQRSVVPVKPVHINVAFDLPLTPSIEAAALLEKWAESLNESSLGSLLSTRNQQEIAWLNQKDLPPRVEKTLVVAGDGAGAIAQQFAQKLGLPLAAEPSSNARFSPNAIVCYTDVLRSELGEEITRVAVFGHPTLTRPVNAIINSSQTQTFFYEPHPVAWHEENRLPGQVIRDIDSLAQLTGHGFNAETKSGDNWLNAWQVAGEASYAKALEEIERYQETGEYEGRTAGRALALRIWKETVLNEETLVVGSSNIVRDLDYIAPALPLSPRVFSPRGLAGIDGTIALASGISLATEEHPSPVRLLCGDLTFLHDAGSLNIGPLEKKPNLRIDVLHDGGGGIFATLEHGVLGKNPEYEKTVRRFFTTPHAVELEELARAYRGSEVTIHRV